jgi:hypothetical protein
VRPPEDWQVGEPVRLTVLQVGRVYDGVIEAVEADYLRVRAANGQAWRISPDSPFIVRPGSSWEITPPSQGDV